MTVLVCGKPVRIIDLSNVRITEVKLRSYPSHQTIHASEAKKSLKTRGLTESPFKPQFDNNHWEGILYGRTVNKTVGKTKGGGPVKGTASQEVCGQP